MSNFPATQLYSGGNSPSESLNIVMLSDGYQASELANFLVRANAIATAILAEQPINKYTAFINIWAISVPSNQSGSSHAEICVDCPPPSVQPKIAVDNYFGSSFDNFGIHRALFPTKSNLVSPTILSSLPQLTGIKTVYPLMVVNTIYDGGLDFGFAVTNANANSNDIALHEIFGHQISGLGDCYQYSVESWNSQSHFNPKSFIKWKWLFTNDTPATDGIGAGLYPMANGGVSAYPTCKMRALGYGFCKVCQDEIASAFTKLVNPIISASPVGATTLKSGGSQVFSINCIKPNPDTLEVLWLLDGTPVGNGYSYTMINDVQTVGTHTLTAIVQDGSVRLQPATQYKATWTVTTVTHSSSIDLTVYPHFVIPPTQIIPPAIATQPNPDNYRILTNWTAIALPPNYVTVYYEIQLSTDGINFNSVNTVTGTTNTQTHLVGNTNYWMRMRTDYWNGSAMTYGNWSPSQTFKTLPTP